MQVFICKLKLGERFYPNLLNFVWTCVAGGSLRRTNTPGGWVGTQQRSTRGRSLVRGGYDARSLPGLPFI